MKIKKASSSFLGGVLALSGGTLVAQAIGVLSSPVISRLFGPEAFGFVAVFNSVVTILCVFGCLSYHWAISLPKEDGDAANLLWLCIVLVVALSLLMVGVSVVCGTPLLEWIGKPQLVPHQGLLVLCFCVTSLVIPLQRWNARQMRFKQQGAVRIVGALGTAIASIALGVVGFRSGDALNIAQIVGVVVTLLLLVWYLVRDDLAFAVHHGSLRGVWNMAVRYRNFPLMIQWSGLIWTLSEQLVPILLDSYFAPVVTGLYALGRRLLQMPAELFSAAISEVFFQRAGMANAEGGELASLLENVCRRLFAAGLLPCLLIAMVGPDLFGFIFGAPWRDAGLYASIMALGVLGSFIGGPVSRMLMVLERQGLALFINIWLLAGRVGALVIGGHLRSIVWTLVLFSAIGVVFGILHVAVCTRLTRANPWVILREAGRHTLYAVPSVLILLFVQHILCLSPVWVLAATIPASASYAIPVLKTDPEMRGAAMRIINKMPFLRRWLGSLIGG